MTQKPHKLALIGLLVILPFGFGIGGCASHGPALDTAVSPLIANDMTAPIEGCGRQPIAGYTYCRKTEGQTTEEKLHFYAPPAKCDKKPCVYVTIYSPNGSPALNMPFEAGETHKAVSWTTLLGSSTFRAGDRGMWLYCLDIAFTGPDQIEHKTTTCGEIRLRVVKSDYTPLHSLENHNKFIWIWCQNQWTIKMTSSGRTFIGDDHENLCGR